MSAPYRPVTLDESAQLLAMSYRLRYQSFVLERLFFSKDNYPRQLEFDAFDRVSVHVGVLDAHDALVGTTRIVPASPEGFPLFRHCRLYSDDTTVEDPANVVVELSRVCLNDHWDRRAAARPIAPGEERRAPPALPPSPEPGREANDPFAAMIKGVYHATKRLHVTHWIVAMEKGLRRRLMHYGLPFRQAGPEADYHGPVAPYVLSLAELDEVILTRRFPALNDILRGLEPDFWPSSMAHTGV
jgi:N-acyl amino acid synthase of PEP-CTERM/exosortase system